MRYLDKCLLLLTVASLLLISCDLTGDATSTPQAAAPTATPLPTPTPTPVPTPTPTPREIAAQIGKATQGSSSFHFAITLSGKPVYADPSGFFVLKSVQGDLKRPDQVLATLKVTSSGSVIEVRTVSLAGKQYLTNPITRSWFCAGPSDAVFDPVVLFDPAKGVESLIQQHFDNATLVGVEDRNGKPHYHLQGTIAGPPLMAISSNSLGIGTVKVDVWADLETLRVSDVVLVDSQTDQASPSTWQMTFSDYDKAVDVRAPVQC